MTRMFRPWLRSLRRVAHRGVFDRCVYPYVDVRHGGATEATPMTPPPGAYANSCVAREQLFQYFSRTRGTPGRTIRLNYAIDMRYGVLFDVASRVKTGEPIDLSTGHVNVVWQGDANAMVLRALGHAPRPRPRSTSAPGDDQHPLARAGVRLNGLQKPVCGGRRRPRGWSISPSDGAFGYPRVSLARLIAGPPTGFARTAEPRQADRLWQARWRVLIPTSGG